MTQKQLVSLFAGLKSKLPDDTRASKALICAFLRTKGFNVNVWVPTYNENARLAHLDVAGYRRKDKIAVSIGGKRAGTRDIAKLLQLPDVVAKVVIIHHPGYEPKMLDNGVLVIGL